MNILHLSRTMGQGGAEKVIYQLCSGTEDIFENIIIMSCGGAYVKKLNNSKIKHYQIPDMDKKNPIIMGITLLKILYIIKKENIDIVHSHHRMASLYSRMIGIVLPKVKQVYTAHNIFYDKKKLTAFSLKKSQIIAVGSDVKTNLIDVFNVNSKSIHTIYNSISLPDIFGEGNRELAEFKEQGYQLIGNIGRISEQKGMEYFVQAIRNVKKEFPKVKGIVVGDGEDRKVLEALILSLGIEKDLILLGYQDNILEIIKQLDLVVLSSLWEGFPLTPIETFSVGKTIIATDINGTNEIVEHGYNGLLVPVKDINKLSDAITKLCIDNKYKAFLERNAKNTYNENFSYEKFLRDYKKMYSLLH